MEIDLLKNLNVSSTVVLNAAENDLAPQYREISRLRKIGRFIIHHIRV
jgi:hypothetical protein